MSIAREIVGFAIEAGSDIHLEEDLSVGKFDIKVSTEFGLRRYGSIITRIIG